MQGRMFQIPGETDVRKHTNVRTSGSTVQLSLQSLNHPTDYFTIIEPQNPSIDKLCAPEMLVEIFRSFNIGKGLVGLSYESMGEAVMSRICVILKITS